jgi:uncharacterized membrane protein YfcA
LPVDWGGVSAGGFLLVFLAAAIGGAINSIAGGGTLITFPAIVWLGVPPLSANATSTVALWPGSFGSMWAYRGELRGARTWLTWFTVPSLAGGIAGAILLLHTSEGRFDHIVPFLVLGATVLFLLQGPISRRLSKNLADEGETGEALPKPSGWFLLGQFGVAVYGGYFGAGIGILMLAALGAMGLKNIHRMNGLKNWGAMCINAVAALTFVASGIVTWPVAIAMAAGGLTGGYGGARLALRVGQRWVRRAVVAIGFGAFAWLLIAR